MDKTAIVPTNESRIAPWGERKEAAIRMEWAENEDTVTYKQLAEAIAKAEGR